MLKEVKVFRDPLYGYVKIYDEPIWQLINTPEFQRLRRITQLGGASMVFHTAEHSRFSHSLGVYEMARQMIYSSVIKDNLTEKERLAVLCAALLHDIGHGPFSHAFEAIFKAEHETITARIITEDSSVHRVLKSVSSDFPDVVASLIMGTHKNKLMMNIISGEIDADRLDYLQRDSYFTGAKYGLIDFGRILRTIRVKRKELVIKVSGLHTIEDFLLSRYHMFQQIYLHPTTRSFEMMLEVIFKRVGELIDSGYTFKTDIELFKQLAKNQFIPLQDYLALDDVTIMYKISQFSKEQDSTLSSLAYALLNRNLFKHVDIPQKDIDVVFEEFVELYQNLLFDPRYFFVKSVIPSKKIFQYHNRTKTNIPIKFLFPDGKTKRIEQISDIYKAISAVTEKADCKIFYSKDMIEELPDYNRDKLKELIKKYDIEAF